MGRRRLNTATGFAPSTVSLILLAALTLPFLSACSMRSAQPLDNRLTAPCERPVLAGETNRDVWALAVEQAYALGECDGRIRAIRELTR